MKSVSLFTGLWVIAVADSLRWAGVKKDPRGAITEGADGGQNSGDTGGSHAADVMTAPFAMTGTASPITAVPASAEKRTYSAAEKTACSIEAMKRGEECEACQ